MSVLEGAWCSTVGPQQKSSLCRPGKNASASNRHSDELSVEGKGAWYRVPCTVLGAGLSPQHQQALQQLHGVQGGCLTACLSIDAAPTQAFCHSQLLWVPVLICVNAVGDRSKDGAHSGSTQNRSERSQAAWWAQRPSSFLGAPPSFGYSTCSGICNLRVQDVSATDRKVQAPRKLAFCWRSINDATVHFSPGL